MSAALTRDRLAQIPTAAAIVLASQPACSSVANALCWSRITRAHSPWKYSSSRGTWNAAFPFGYPTYSRRSDEQ